MPLMHLDNDLEFKERSVKDIKDIITVLVCTGIRDCQAYSSLSHNWGQQIDLYGRTALHLAASFGKADILEWLLELRKVDLNQKDLESGYTPLHRALFYGQLNCARLLIQYNCDLQVRDIEGLSPIDIPMMDRPSNITYSLKEPNEVYTWGENNNSTIGHSSPHSRGSPEAIDFFKKSGVSIKQIVLCKYHSVFLSQTGHVYTCGHGHGGRLGHNDQKTILVPRKLENVQEHTCLEIAAATDHTALRMAGGLVYTFGLNNYHQLGLTPYVESSPIPKLMNLKSLKGKSISGVCVGRFHTVVWTPDSVFTVGLNAGQLGHQRGEKFQTTLRQVSYLRHTDLGISKVSCSDAATVCLTTKGDVYILHEYQCKKIASKWQEIDMVLVTGGNLDHTLDLDIFKETRGQELRVLIKNEPGQIFLWRINNPTLKRCHFDLKHQLWISDVAMTSTTLLLATDRGEAFSGNIPTKPQSAIIKDIDNRHCKDQVKDLGDGFNQPRLLDLLLKDEIEEISVKRIANIHRAVLVAADKKGRDFAIIQALPNGCLTEFPVVTSSEINEQFRCLCDEANMEDNIHDAVIKVGDRSWPVHKYIIAARSDYFCHLVAASPHVKGEEMVFTVDNVNPEIMEQIIYFMYTDTCDYLQLGHKIVHQSLANHNSVDTKNSAVIKGIPDGGDTKGLSAYQAQQKLARSNKQKSQHDFREESHQTQNPVRMLQEAARRFGVKGLAKRLDAVKCSSDVISSQGKTLVKPKVKFDRTKLPELYDVSISSEDGEEIDCHKCVLVARLEYFCSMLSTGWVETFNTNTLRLPVPGQVLKILIDYLYCDDAPYLKDCVNEDLLCSVLVISDQLLATRLKEMCEVSLANTISFKSVSELLEFSTLYNAKQLKLSCQQFICLNLPAMLEGRYLDVLSQETMNDLTKYYRSFIPNMAYRMMTPETGGPYQDYIDEVLAELETTDKEDAACDLGSAKKAKQPAKKSKMKYKKSSPSEDKAKSLAADVSSQRSTVSQQNDRKLSVSPDARKSAGVTKLEDEVKAVIDDLNKQAEEDNKRLQAMARSKEKMKWKPLLVPTEIVTPAPTPPEAVHRWTSNMWTLTKSSATGYLSIVPESSPNKIEVSPESATPTSPTNLRDIMSQEAHSAEKTRSSFSSKFNWKDVKKQQSKEVKQQKQSSSDQSERSTPSSKVISNPWSSVSVTVKSLRDVMIQEEKTVSAPVAIPGAKRDLPQSINSPCSLGKTPKSPVRDVMRSGDNPWTRGALTPVSPPGSSINFSSILLDEKEKCETLVRTQQKPLALIQLEERAMNELLEHYKAGQSTDRHITVERVSKAMAAPLWNREAKSVNYHH